MYIFVNDPAFFVVSIAFAMWLIRSPVERVGDSLVKCFQWYSECIIYVNVTELSSYLTIETIDVRLSSDAADCPIVS